MAAAMLFLQFSCDVTDVCDRWQHRLSGTGIYVFIYCMLIMLNCYFVFRFSSMSFQFHALFIFRSNAEIVQLQFRFEQNCF